MPDQVVATIEPVASPTTDIPLVTLGTEARDASFAALDAAISTMLVGAPEDATPVKAEPSQAEVAPKLEPAKEAVTDPTDLVSRAIRLDRDTHKKAKEHARQVEEFRPTLERSKRIEEAVKSGNILAVLHEVAPDKDPSAAVVELLEQLSDGEKTLNPAQIKEMIDKAAQEKYESVQKATEAKAKAEAEEANNAGFNQYIGACANAIDRAEKGDYTFLGMTDTGIGKVYRDMILSNVAEIHGSTGKVISPTEAANALEDHFVNIACSSPRVRKRLGITQSAPAMSTTISASLASPSPQAGSPPPARIDPYAMRAQLEADRKRLDDDLLAQFQR